MRHLKDWMRQLKHFRIACLLGIFLCTGVLAQNVERDSVDAVTPPDAVMQKVVGRIVGWYFKPGKSPRTVRLSEAIKPGWLPAIKNIGFEFVPDHEVYKYKRGVFFVESIALEGDIYSVNVGWRDGDCDASGETWKFRSTGGKVKVWPTKSGWGRGCSGSSPPRVRGLKIGDISPNELPGYEFFAKGKLKDIRLGISTRQDMEEIFGESCEGVCDYDENWRIFVNYLEKEGDFTQTTSSDGVETKTAFETKPQYLGKLSFVTMIPKHRISFARVKFSNAFSNSEGYSIGHSLSGEGFLGAVHSTNKTFTDGFGLEYRIFEKETFNNLPRTDDGSAAARERLRRHDLAEITYEIPNTLNDEIYTRRPAK